MAKIRSYLEQVKVASLKYFDETHTLKDGTPLPKEFPWGTAATPPIIACRKDSVMPTAKTFSDNETWKALGFAPDPKLPYQYEYRSDGQDEYAFFEFTIRGDLDCDGYFSVFTIGARTEGTLKPTVRGPDISSEFE